MKNLLLIKKLKLTMKNKIYLKKNIIIMLIDYYINKFGFMI